MYVRKFCMYALQEDCDALAVFVFQCSTVYKYLFQCKRFSTPDTGVGELIEQVGAIVR